MADRTNPNDGCKCQNRNEDGIAHREPDVGEYERHGAKQTAEKDRAHQSECNGPGQLHEQDRGRRDVALAECQRAFVPQSHGDAVEEIDSCFYLVGRGDGRSSRRKPVDELLAIARHERMAGLVDQARDGQVQDATVDAHVQRHARSQSMPPSTSGSEEAAVGYCEDAIQLATECR